MKLQDMLYFNKLVKLKSYTEVSKFFEVKQPTVTMAIKRLEDEFNIDLVKRDHSHRAITISKAGQKLFEHTKLIGDEITAINGDMQKLTNNPIHFGLPPIIGNYYFPKLATNLVKRNILSDIRNKEDGSNKLLENLKSGLIDIALIGSVEPMQNKEIAGEVLTKDQFHFVVPKNSKFANYETLTFNDIENEKMVLLSSDYVHNQVFDNMCNHHFIHPEIAYRSQDFELVKKMISENLGVGFLVKHAVSDHDNLITIPINDQDLPPFYISVAYRTSHKLNLNEKELIETIEDSVK
ncbi:LysR family transcriptional regulator [Lactobacillus sp. S2-2]|uniref:LysR family transcriptional regulator n=1 Tax=Lactobacillus sp. S2-2 TaxID=2692917 RepID=UPI001F3FDD03|nr:LysR family transcriptional regulator [Lactobacillus sp. S2-2]MCF6515291.1 LysR family transcriptional regulator [Lactobacillus sp. S2-2]